MTPTIEQQRQELRQRIARLRRRIDGELRAAARPAVAVHRASSWLWIARAVAGFGLGFAAKHRGDLNPLFKAVWRFVRNLLRPSRKPAASPPPAEPEGR